MKDACEINTINRAAVEYARKRLPGGDEVLKISMMFKTLSDPTRIRIIEALAIRELCVCDLAALLGLTQSAASHQLRLLRQADIVRYRRDGKIIYYSLSDEHVADLLKAVGGHARHTVRR